jgi:hypothetical protein
MILFDLCFALAKEITRQHRGEFDAQNFDAGGSSSRASTAFSRTGTSTQGKSFTLPSDLANLIRQAYTGSALPKTTTDNESNLLNSLLTRTIGNVPGLSTLQTDESIDPTSYTGASTLNTMSQRNPYSRDYENAIGDLYDRQFAKGRAMAQSGPTNVRGGTARQGFEMAELSGDQARNKFREVRGQQDKEAGVVQGAVQTMNQIESMRRGSRLTAQSQHQASESARTGEALHATGMVDSIRKSNQGNINLAGDMLGNPIQTTKDDLKGRGAQSASGSNWGAGLTCCFIFLQALNGELPEWVRRGRDQFCTLNRRNGYNWLAGWLVPFMRRSILVTRMVNWIMIKPFLLAGDWKFGGKRTLVGPVVAHTICRAWFLTWSFIGWTYGKLV